MRSEIQKLLKLGHQKMVLALTEIAKQKEQLRGEEREKYSVSCTDVEIPIEEPGGTVDLRRVMVKR